MKAFSLTDIGKKRQMNQDHLYTSLEPVGNLPNIFLVADGMGGHRAGGYASSCAVETILQEAGICPEEEVEQILTRAIRRANEVIAHRAEEDERFAGMGTTVVAACLKQEELIAANVGDSRLYVVHDDSIEQVTEDHSLVQEMVKYGGINREEARVHPNKNIITRAVGLEEDLQVDCFRRTLRRGERVLLCSDGLTDMLEDEQIRRIIDKNRDVRSAAQALVKAANDNGGRDNIAVIVIDPFT
ncbi:MAG TPA: Stp1/IreP family PP2C-type Ser/Thr phosphatase [Candidatus Eisenbergiella stercoravium]|nr:Stp1/IreP family PP2C-type Ser/Thr phosphatase [Candidatus Eisenbergiella stercoravium]